MRGAGDNTAAAINAYLGNWVSSFRKLDCAAQVFGQVCAGIWMDCAQA